MSALAIAVAIPILLALWLVLEWYQRRPTPLQRVTTQFTLLSEALLKSVPTFREAAVNMTAFAEAMKRSKDEQDFINYGIEENSDG